jgi:UDPglucose--hexose-1-phosphate uridylyltransferase
MKYQIQRLVNFGLQKGLLKMEDKEYVVNRLLETLQEESFEEQEIYEELTLATTILEEIVDVAIKRGLIEDTTMARDAFDTKVMGCLMPRPSEVLYNFETQYKINPTKATEYYYNMSVSSNYIRKSRTDKNIAFTHFYKYGDIQITINISKPEKDPKDIIQEKQSQKVGYPKCLLCKENVGFAGNIHVPARQNHRIIPIYLYDTTYYLQYSPYVYYNEHCIILNENHIPMVINEATFARLLSFVELFPHYMVGSNADLPIVGGSILAHDHFQGGKHKFPIEDAKVIMNYPLRNYDSIKVEMLHWPLSTIRLTSTNKEAMLLLANTILNTWKDYSDAKVGIQAYSNTTRHNTITPIARKKDGAFQIDLVLRNNRTSKEYPDGIFHPHGEHHHIKKENIGLIEVMGLAILPARLKEELSLLEKCLLDEADIHQNTILNKHVQWYSELKKKYTFTKDNCKKILEQEVTVKFVRVLEDAGVFKMNEQGIEAFIRFMKTLEEKV